MGESLAPKLALYAIAQVLQGLSFVHGVTGSDGQPLGLIHRDISPQNILCSWNGGVKIADFGIAKGTHRTAHTVVNQIKGKYAYMSPEQASGKRVDQRVDLYATGIILFELLSGKRLYEGTSDLEVIEMVKSSRIPLELISHVPPELRQVCAIALSRDRDDRYQSASEFLSAVNQCAVTTGQIAYAGEFGDYLRELFPSDVQNIDERLALAANDCGVGKTRVMTLPSQKIDKERWFDPPSFKRGLVVSSLIIMGMVLPAGASKDAAVIEQVPARVESEQVMLTKPQPQPEPAPEPAQPVNQPSIAEIVGTNAQPKQVAPKEPVSPTGSISVSAQPWGVITIPGYVSGRESPLRGVRVKNGTHTVTVKHAPTNAQISREVKVAGNSVRCFARFGARSTMSCK
jgi:serine/threonine protein kinase